MNKYLNQLSSGSFFMNLLTRRVNNNLSMFLYKKLFIKIDQLIKVTLRKCTPYVLRFSRKYLGRCRLQKKIVFTNFKGNGYGDNPKYICEEIIRRKLPVDIVWLVSRKKLNDKNRFPKKVRLVTYGTARAFYEIYTAKVFVKNVRDYSTLIKRKGQLFIQTWHGAIGIKKSGADIIEAVRTEEWLDKVKRESNINDIILSNSPVYTEILRSSYLFNQEYDGKILEIGHPRNDVFFKPVEKYRDKIEKKYPSLKGKHIALYAPTYREDNVVFTGNIDFRKLVKELEAKFGGEWIIMVRYHPRCFQTATKIILPEDCTVNATWHDDMQELLAISDLGITDYSSWIYDFMLSGKPGFIHAPDSDVYEKTRGLYFQLDETPFPVSRSSEELLSNIQNFDQPNYKKKLTNFIENKKIEENGKSSSNIVDRIVLFMKIK